MINRRERETKANTGVAELQALERAQYNSKRRVS